MRAVVQHSAPPAMARQVGAPGALAFPKLVADGYTEDMNTFNDTFFAKEELSRRGAPTYPSLEDWIEIFRASIPGFRSAAAADPSVPFEREERSERFAAAYGNILDELEQRAASNGADGSDSGARIVTCIQLCQLREDALHAAGFTDIFLSVKQKENRKALTLLGSVCREIDGHLEPRARWEAALRGVFAGNIFDLGCTNTATRYHQEGGVPFRETREALVSRPWAVDDFGALTARLAGHSYKKAVLFVDNAGADVILGMLPLARELLRRGTTVILAANEGASINDITAAELDALLPSISHSDAVLCKAISTRRLQVVASGSSLPVLDLTQLSEELVEASQDADLVVLEGMGRAIETNLRARFTCDAVWLGLIKHKEVAAALNARLYDCVCKLALA